jgi:hypothetical protein
MHTLMAYSWPGNVRELKSAIECALIACKDTMIQIEDLPPEVLHPNREFPTLPGTPQDEKTRIVTALENARLYAMLYMTAADALAKVRRVGGEINALRVLPVTDESRRLVGVVDLPTVVTAEPSARIGDLARPDTYSVRVDEDQEVAARLEEHDPVEMIRHDHVLAESYFLPELCGTEPLFFHDRSEVAW